MTIQEQTLRDHYAGLAMQAIIQSSDQMDAALIISSKATLDNEKLELQDAVAMMAYAHANSMIKIRNKIDNDYVQDNKEE